jgi:hypothetical protein
MRPSLHLFQCGLHRLTQSITKAIGWHYELKKALGGEEVVQRLETLHISRRQVENARM